MKENVKYQDSRVTFGRGRRGIEWYIACFCLFIFTRSGFAFLPGIMVSGNLEFNGNGIVVDSFDSSMPGDNINGQYSPGVSGDEGIIYAGLTGSNSVDIGDALVYGVLYTSLTTVVSVGPNGAVGTHAWIDTGGTGIEPGYSFTESNVTLVDVNIPSGSSYLQPGSGQVVTEDGPATNQTFLNQTNLPTLSSNQMLEPITTNTVNITTYTYPGPLPGLVTNFTTLTTQSYPGDVPGLSTNCVSFITVTNDPGPQVCLSSNEVVMVTNADYPGPIFGLITNTIITPPCITAITNPGCSDPITSATPPDSWCVANGVLTNCGAATTSTAYPSPGTFCPGTVITNYLHGGTGGPIVGYTYLSFGGYTYTTNTQTVTYSTNYDCPGTTNYTYSYLTGNFTYASQLSYTYPTLTYTYPTFTYNYTIYTAWTYRTNYYDNILSGGNYFSSNALVGNTVATGPSTLVMSNFGGNIAVAPGGSLTVYVQSGSCSININEITNKTGLASNLVILCSPEVSFLTVSGMGSFAGIVYAPEAAASIDGGAVGLDYSGSLGANSLNALGDFRMHYDEALALAELDFTIFYVPPPRPMTLYPLGITTNGQFQFFGDASPGYSWVVETSTDLVNWTPVMTNTGTSPNLFTDTNGVSAGQCFYRTFYIP